MRIINCILGFLLCYIISKDIFHSLSVFFIIGGGNLINDYFDWEVDKKKGKKQIFSKNLTLISSIILFSIGIVLSKFKILGILATILLIIYPMLARYKYFGNFIIAFLCAILPIYAGYKNYDIPFIIFLAFYIREIIKDFEDMKADIGKKITLPIVDKNFAFEYLNSLFLTLIWTLLLFKEYVLIMFSLLSWIFLRNYSISQKILKVGAGIFILLWLFGFV